MSMTDNDLSGLTQEPSQTQGEFYGDKSENEADGENYRLLLKSAADLANLSGNETCDFKDHIIGIMESDAEFSESDAKEEQLKIADLEPQPIEKPKKNYAIINCKFHSKLMIFFKFFGNF